MCQASGAVHVNLMHIYGNDAFLLQWDSFTSIRDIPKKVISDLGGQLVAASNVTYFQGKESLANWGRNEKEQRTMD